MRPGRQTHFMTTFEDPDYSLISFLVLFHLVTSFITLVIKLTIWTISTNLYHNGGTLSGIDCKQPQSQEKPNSHNSENEPKRSFFSGPCLGQVLRERPRPRCQIITPDSRKQRFSLGSPPNAADDAARYLFRKRLFSHLSSADQPQNVTKDSTQVFLYLHGHKSEQLS